MSEESFLTDELTEVLIRPMTAPVPKSDQFYADKGGAVWTLYSMTADILDSDFWRAELVRLNYKVGEAIEPSMVLTPAEWATWYAEQEVHASDAPKVDGDVVPPGESVQQLRALIEAHGMDKALQVLNKRVPHRFTAIYRFNGEAMVNVSFADKQGEPLPPDFASVPVGSSFCQFVMRDGWLKLEGDDPRLEGHVYRGVMQSYVGMPLMRSDSEVYGTFCHFDFPPVSIPDSEFGFLTRVAKVLPSYL